MATGSDGSIVIDVDINDEAMQQQLDTLANRLSQSFGSVLDRAVEQITTQLSQLGEQANNSGDEIDDALGNGSRAHRAVSDFGNTLSIAFGNMLANAIEKISEKIVQLGQDVIQAGISFESAFAGVKKTVDETANISYADLEQSIRDMAKETPAVVEEIAGVAEAAGQLGIAAEDITTFSQTMIDLGNSTNLSAQNAASALAKFANITKTSSDEYGKLGAAIVDLGNNYATTEQDIVNMSTRLAATATSAGITEQGILALSTALSSVGIEAEAGGTAMSTFIKKIQTAVETQSDSLTKYAEVAGMTSEAFSELFSKDGAQAINAFLTGLNRIDKEGGSALSVLNEMGLKEIRLSNAILALSNSGDLLTRTLQTSTTAWEEEIALIEEASKRYETTESKLQILKNSINDLYISLSQSLSLGFDTAPLTDSINRLNDAFKADGFNGMLLEAQDILGISDKTVHAIKKLAEQLSNLASAAVDAVKGIMHAIEQTSGSVLDTFVDHILPLIIDGLEWIADNGEIVNGLIHAFFAAWVTNKLKIVATDIGGLITNISTMSSAITATGNSAAIAASKLNIYLGLIQLAAVAGYAIAGAIDSAAENIGYEGEMAEAYNETNKAIAEQVQLLDELYKTDKRSAYDTAKSGLTDTMSQLDAANQKIRDFHKQQEGLDNVINNALGTDNWRSYLDSGESGSIYDAQVLEWMDEADAIEAEVKKLEEQVLYLENLKSTQKHIVRDLQGFETSPEHVINQDILNEQGKKAEAVLASYADKVKDLRQEQSTFLSEEEAKNLHYLAEIAKESGEISESEYYSRVEAIANQLDTESDLYKQYNKEVVKGRADLADDLLDIAKDAAKDELEAAKKALDDLSDAYEDKYNDIIDKRDSYKRRLMGADIFTVTTKTDEKTGEEQTVYSIENLNKLLKARKDYAKQISALEQRDINSNLLAELEGLDTEQAAVFAKQLNKMSDSEFKQLNDAYTELDETTTQLANSRYQHEIDSLQTEFADKAKAILSTLSADLQNAGINTLQSFIDGFSLNKPIAFKELDTFADNVVSSIKDGITDGSVDISDNLSQIIGDSNIGSTFVDNIVNSIADNQNELQNAIETVLGSTGLDMQIRADVENAAVTNSAKGYEAAQAVYITQQAQPTQQTAQQAVTQHDVFKNVMLKLTDNGRRIIADIVNEENARLQTQGGT